VHKREFSNTKNNIADTPMRYIEPMKLDSNHRKVYSNAKITDIPIYNNETFRPD
jgi:hypothetical protein